MFQRHIMKGVIFMGCKSAIYAVNTQDGLTINNGGVYVPSTIIRRYGKYCQLGNYGVNIGSNCECDKGGIGYYNVDAIANVISTATGTVTASLYQDGVIIPGATVTVTSSEVGENIVLPISALIRLKCNCDESLITVVISGQNTTSSNLSFRVEKE